MPSASASATPLALSTDAVGIDAPWKSCCVCLRPLSDHWPIETFSESLIDGAGGAESLIPRRLRAEALRCRAHVGGVERQTDEGDAAHQVADHGRDLVPDEVVRD